MRFETILESIPPVHWETDQVIALDWYDGPRAGLCALAQPCAEFFFEMEDEKHNPDGLDDRLFRLRELPIGTLQKATEVLKPLGASSKPVWAPGQCHAQET